MRDVFVHVERETDQGIVVSGAKMLATGSAITNATFVAPVASAQMEAGKAEDFAVVFFARMDNPGLRLMCRPSYEERASSPFDYPLSSRFDENDSVLLFDKALIPWEDVLVYRDLRRATGFYSESGFANLYNFQSGIRLGVKLELMIGLLSLGVRANGTQGFRGIQAALGELIALQHLLQALTTAMARDPERNAAGSAVPRLSTPMPCASRCRRSGSGSASCWKAPSAAPRWSPSRAPPTCATARRGGWWTATTAVPSWSRSSA